MNYGKSLKQHRELAGLNQPELAKSLETSQQNISRWENGQVIPGIDFCIKLAKFYGITLDELVGLSDTPHEEKTAPLPKKLNNHQISFVKEYSDVIDDENYINMSKLYKNITPTLRALTLGYIVGLLQNNGVDTKEILGY